MSYTEKQIKTDINDKPVPQYFNDNLQDFEVLQGQSGASKVMTVDSDGNESNVNIAVQPILDKLTQLTGTVIDENTRKTNEVDRIQLYEDLLIELNRIEQITEQVPQNVLDAIDLLNQKLAAHKAESATQAGGVHGIRYEEGSFTPYIEGSSDAVYSVQDGRYKRINNVAIVNVELALTSKGTHAGAIFIDGLPFISKGVSGNTLVRVRGVNLTTGEYLTGHVNGKYTFIYLFRNSASADATNLNKSSIKDDFRFILTMTYNI